MRMTPAALQGKCQRPIGLHWQSCLMPLIGCWQHLVKVEIQLWSAQQLQQRMLMTWMMTLVTLLVQAVEGAGVAADLDQSGPPGPRLVVKLLRAAAVMMYLPLRGAAWRNRSQWQQQQQQHLCQQALEDSSSSSSSSSQVQAQSF